MKENKFKSFNELIEEKNNGFTFGEHFDKIMDELPWRNYYGGEFCDLFEHMIPVKPVKQ
jgi:hypothetical protein